MGPMLRYELKRTWRSPVPWVLLLTAAALWVAALLYGSAGRPGGWQAPSLAQHGNFVFFFPVFLVLLGAYLAWEAQRDRRSALETVFLGWPVSSWRWAAARTLALGSVTMANWLLLTSLDAVYAVYSYASVAGIAGNLGGGQLLRDIGIMAVDLMASLLAAQATAQVAAAVVPGIGGLVLVIFYRLFALLGPGLVMGILQWPYILLAGPELATWWPWFWQPMGKGFGLAPYETLFWTHRAFWIGGSLGILAFLVFLYRNRRDRPAVQSSVWAGTALLAALLCAIPFVAHGKALTDAFDAVVAEYGETAVPQSESEAIMRVWSGAEASARPEDPLPVRYEIEADLSQGPEGRFQVLVEVELRAPVSEIPLTLRRVFQVESVAVDGNVLATGAVVRSGDLLRIPLGREMEPGERVGISLTYSGRIEDWRMDGPPRLVAGARREMLLVPATWGWYPVPGAFTLTYRELMNDRSIVDRQRTFGGAAPYFDVTLRAPAGIYAVAGFVPVDEPGAAGCRWRLEGVRQQVSLVGGHWWAREREGITYLVPREYLDTWETASADLHAILKILTEWAGPERLIVVPIGVSETTATDPDMVESESFGPVYQVSPDRTDLTDQLAAWMFFRYEVPARRDGSPDETEFVAAEWFAGVVKYVELRVREEFGEAISPDERAYCPEWLWRWAETTSLSEQKRQIRQLFAAAQSRPLTRADFAFLERGGGE